MRLYSPGNATTLRKTDIGLMKSAGDVRNEEINFIVLKVETPVMYWVRIKVGIVVLKVETLVMY